MKDATDYEAIETSVTLGIGSENDDMACVNITIIDNDAHEVDKDFSVNSDVGNLTVFIEDEDGNDSPALSLSNRIEGF